MPDWLINLGASWMGIKTLWDKLDGLKTYIGAVAEMLTGLASILGGLASEINAFLASAHDLGSAVNFVVNLAHNWKTDPTAVLIAGGWVVFLHGWTSMAQRHAHDKLSEQIAQANSIPVPNAPKI